MGNSGTFANSRTLFGELPSGLLAPRSVTADLLADGAVTSRAVAAGGLPASVITSEAWTAYTPSNVNVTVGNGIQAARYIRLGRTIHFRYHLIWGSTTSFGGTANVGLPIVTAAQTNSTIGAGLLLDSGTRFFVATGAVAVGGAHIAFIHTESSNVGIVNATAPFIWTTNDILTITGTYEAAS